MLRVSLGIKPSIEDKFSVLSAHFRGAKNIMGRGVLLFLKDRRFFSNEENAEKRTGQRIALPNLTLN